MFVVFLVPFAVVSDSASFLAYNYNPFTPLLAFNANRDAVASGRRVPAARGAEGSRKVT
jgi:hypothetical protein